MTYSEDAVSNEQLKNRKAILLPCVAGALINARPAEHHLLVYDLTALAMQ